MIRRIRGTGRVLFFTLMTVLFLGVFFLVLPFRHLRQQIIKTWHTIVCWLLGLTIRVEGGLDSASNVIVANHISYIDIPVMGSVAPMTFISKADVANWPVFGWLSRVAGTYFVERDPRKARQQPEMLKNGLMMGERLAFYPEGTSTDGLGVVCFKSTLFEGVITASEGRPVVVQTLSLAYLYDQDGNPLMHNPAQAAWFDDSGFFEHLWDVFCDGGFEIHLKWGKSFAVQPDMCRKDLAQTTELAVRHGLYALLSKVDRAYLDKPMQIVPLNS